MVKVYAEPTMEVVKFDVADVITASAALPSGPMVDENGNPILPDIGI